MSLALGDIRGMTPVVISKLKELGICDTALLLNAISTRSGREELVKQVGISAEMVWEWAKHLELVHVKGIGPVCVQLLEHAGVDSIRKLAASNPEMLHALLVQVNAGLKLARQVPGQKVVRKWIAEARQLPRLIQD